MYWSESITAALDEDQQFRSRMLDEKRLRVILVAYHFPPDTAVGALRARNVAQALLSAGHEVHVVTSAVHGSKPVSAEGPLHIVRVPSNRSPRDLLTGLATRVRRLRPNRNVSAAPPEHAVAAGWRAPTQVSALRRWIEAAAWLPDDQQGFILPATRAVSEIVDRYGADLLYTTAPPFSDHLVGLLSQRSVRLKWVAEFRDPWTDNPWKPWFVRTVFTDWLERWLERRCLQAADGIVTVTKSYNDLLRGRPDVNVRNKTLVVRNGVPTGSPRRITADPSVFRIVYAGSFYHSRDPRPFLAGLAGVRARLTTNRRFEVQLVGDCRHFEGEPLAPEIARLGLGDVVRFSDWLPHAESLELIRSADLLLLLAQNQPLQVPNKLYEYLGTGVPILAFADAGGETSHLLHKAGGHYVISEDDDLASIQGALLDAWDRPRKAASQATALEALFTATQMQTLETWLKSLVRVSE